MAFLLFYEIIRDRGKEGTEVFALLFEEVIE